MLDHLYIPAVLVSKAPLLLLKAPLEAICQMISRPRYSSVCCMLHTHHNCNAAFKKDCISVSFRGLSDGRMIISIIVLRVMHCKTVSRPTTIYSKKCTCDNAKFWNIKIITNLFSILALFRFQFFPLWFNNYALDNFDRIQVYYI